MAYKKIPTKKRSSRKVWLISVVVAILLAGAAVSLYMFLHRDSSSTDGGQKKYNQSKKSAVINNGGVPVPDNNSGSTDKGSTPSTPYTPPTTDNGITLTPSTSGDGVTIKTKLVGYSDGTCALTVTNGAKTTTQNASVIFAPDFSTCAGFSVPINTLGSGTWNIQLSVTSGGNTTSKTTTYGVQ